MNQTRKILIVDDIAHNIQVSGTILKKEGYDILAALNGKIALNILNERHIDLILLDIAMPEMDGYQICETIKNKEKIKNIPIIFLTAHNQTEDIVKGFKLGAVDYITKPFQPAELLQRVETHLKLKAQQEIIEEKNEKLLKQNNSLIELNATKDKFFNIIAHDLRNPFTAINGFTKLLLGNFHVLEEEKIREFLSGILNSSQSAYKLLENLLTWSRSQTNRLQFRPVEISFYELFSEAFVLHKVGLTNKEIDVEQKIDPEINILADRNMLNTIIRNLITNAIKFTNRKGKITVTAFQKTQQNYMQFSISDTGIGMDKETLEGIFRIDKNVSKEGTEKEKGTGIGLILCKDFIDKHRGQIWAESTLGQGSVFHFIIPLR